MVIILCQKKPPRPLKTRGKKYAKEDSEIKRIGDTMND